MAITIFIGREGISLQVSFKRKTTLALSGPIPLPLIGNVASLYTFESFKSWRKKYGPVHTFWLGNTPTILLSDYEAITEVFQKDGDAFLGREFEYSEHMRGGNHGIIFGEGETWKCLRRFTMHTFQKFGVGKNVMQERVII